MGHRWSGGWYDVKLQHSTKQLTESARVKTPQECGVRSQKHKTASNKQSSKGEVGYVEPVTIFTADLSLLGITGRAKSSAS